MRDYTDHPQLGPYLFEHSFVLGISAEPTSLTLRVDLVLTPEHPRFQAARPGEQMRFETGRIEFREVRELSWSGQGAPPATDANGEGDYGSIDEFVWDQASYSLSGSFGVIKLTAASVQVNLDG